MVMFGHNYIYTLYMTIYIRNSRQHHLYKQYLLRGCVQMYGSAQPYRRYINDRAKRGVAQASNRHAVKEGFEVCSTRDGGAMQAVLNGGEMLIRVCVFLGAL
jgi:hypothetical protein